jgi:hypothetical protein
MGPASNVDQLYEEDGMKLEKNNQNVKEEAKANNNLNNNNNSNLKPTNTMDYPTSSSIKPQFPLPAKLSNNTSPTTAQTLFLSSIVLFIILSAVFFVSSFLFPGAMNPFSNLQDQLLNMKKSLPSNPEMIVQSWLEQPEYSESGAVYFAEDDIPLPKTVVYVK